LNVPAVRLLQQYGILPFKEKLQSAGITTLHYSPDYYGLPLVLGGAEVKLWDLCGAYSSMGRILSHVYKYDHQYSKADIHEPVLFQNIVGTDAIHPDNKKLTNEPPVWNAGAIWLTF